MNFEMLDLIADPQWYCYKYLELVPRSVPKPVRHSNPLTSGLNILWCSLLSSLIDELVEEQRVEYLNRCWSLNVFGEGEQSSSSSLRRLWSLME